MIKDPARVSALLDIVAKVAGGHPQFLNLSGEASAELRELNETIRKSHEEAKGVSVTPAPIGDPESPPQSPPPGMEQSPDFDTHPTASKPVDKMIDEKTPAPKVTAPRAIPSGDMK